MYLHSSTTQKEQELVGLFLIPPSLPVKLSHGRFCSWTLVTLHWIDMCGFFETFTMFLFLLDGTQRCFYRIAMRPYDIAGELLSWPAKSEIFSTMIVSRYLLTELQISTNLPTNWQGLSRERKKTQEIRASWKYS